MSLRAPQRGRGGGAIVCFGTDHSVRARAARALDLAGRAITPGFVSMHAHCGRPYWPPAAARAS